MSLWPFKIQTSPDFRSPLYLNSNPDWPGFSPIKKNVSSEKFSDKNLRLLNPPIFSENLRNFQTKYFGAAGWKISENFPQNILKGTQFENLRKFSEFWEFCQNSEIIFVDRTKPQLVWNKMLWLSYCSWRHKPGVPNLGQETSFRAVRCSEREVVDNNLCLC